MEELISAIDNLPDEQKDIIIKQAIEGKTFKEIAAETDTSINTLLARKRYAVISLKETLSDIKEALNELY
jgi:DNA-directed RNA polymerase specialized sigma24 family protein